jgi:PKD repeat protein
LFKRVFTSSLLIFLLLSSGPLYLPLAYAMNNFTPPRSPSNSTTSYDPSFNQTLYQNQTISQFEEIEPAPPAIEARASPTSGASPLFVTFTGIVHLRAEEVLIYRWDFDGDDVDDFVSLDSGNTTHVYTVDTPVKLQAT